MATLVAMTQDFHEAEDLFQDTVIQIMKSAHTFDLSRDFSPWACTIARNVARKHWRHNSKRKEVIVHDALEFLSETVTEESDIELWHEEKSHLRECIAGLPTRMRTLVELYYGQNCKGDELAKKASIKVGAIYTTLHRLRARLRECISARMKMELAGTV